MDVDLCLRVKWRHEVFTGTAEYIVGVMNKTAFIQNPSDQEYMNAVAERVKIFSGADIDTTDPFLFLVSLQNAHLITMNVVTNGRM